MAGNNGVQKEKVEGTWEGKQVRISREWGGHKSMIPKQYSNFLLYHSVYLPYLFLIKLRHNLTSSTVPMFISRGSVLQIVLFVLLWSVLTIQLARFDKTKRMQAQLIPVFMEYLPKRNRFILTRTSKTATFHKINFPLYIIVVHYNYNTIRHKNTT